MPKISEFFGIAVYMYFSEHNPPHFHAVYGEDEASFVIDTLEVLDGELPRRVRALVLEWAAQHRPELRRNWDLARNGHDLMEVLPLD